jgi:hypothetical protein
MEVIGKPRKYKPCSDWQDYFLYTETRRRIEQERRIFCRGTIAAGKIPRGIIGRK